MSKINSSLISNKESLNNIRKGFNLSELGTHINDISNNVIRIERDQKLADSDWTVMDGSPLSDSKKDEWKTYRQALRDMPSGTVPVIDVDQNIVSGLTWPTEP